MKPHKLLSTILMAVLLLAAAGCDDSEPSPEERAALEEASRTYLFALAKAYSTLDTNGLNDIASPNEILAVRKLLQDLLQKTGDRIHAELVGHDIQTIVMFRGVNSTVRMIEVWNVTRYGAADGIEKGHTENSIQHTLLQMRLVDGRWICVGRSIMSQETPVPEVEGSDEEEPI